MAQKRADSRNVLGVGALNPRCVHGLPIDLETLERKCKIMEGGAFFLGPQLVPESPKHKKPCSRTLQQKRPRILAN